MHRNLRRPGAALVLALLIGAVLTGCQPGRSMWASCTPSADGDPFGTDGTYVLVCRDGIWQPVMTVQEHLAMRRGEHVEIAPLPARPAAPAPPPPTPSPPTPPSPGVARRVVEVAAGGLHTCARYDNGEVRCWGLNRFGELGTNLYTGTTTPNATPQRVAGLSGATRLAAGESHTCALRSDTTVWCWGGNVSGQLGRPGGSGRLGANPPAPVEVFGQALTGVVDLAAGANHTCALISSGMVMCWGDNTSGQIGNGYFEIRPVDTPAAVRGLGTAVRLGLAADHSCAVLSDGGAACWGRGFRGELGSGVADSSAVPVRVRGLTGVVGLTGTAESTCALIEDSSWWCFGSNEYGQLGVATNSGIVVANPDPLRLPGVRGGTPSGGGSHVCGPVSGGVLCWGLNRSGQLGSTRNSGTYEPNPSPEYVRGVGDVVEVASGTNHGCALDASSVVRCWGDNSSGQLGHPVNLGTSTPDPVARSVAGL